MVAGRIADSILEVLRGTGEKSEAGAPISTSIGIAYVRTTRPIGRLCSRMRIPALYRAKNEGRGVYRFFEASMGAAVRDRRLLEHDLRNAIPRGELRLVYQPQKDIRTDRVVGFEALLRWKHATRGEVPPIGFIPIAEDTGTIFQIGEWVLRRRAARRRPGPSH